MNFFWITNDINAKIGITKNTAYILSKFISAINNFKNNHSNIQFTNTKIKNFIKYPLFLKTNFEFKLYEIKVANIPEIIVDKAILLISIKVINKKFLINVAINPEAINFRKLSSIINFDLNRYFLYFGWFTNFKLKLIYN